MHAKLSEETVRALLAEKNWEPTEGWEYVNARTPIPGRCLAEGCGYEGPGPRYGHLAEGTGACIRCAGQERPLEETVRAVLAEKNWEPDEPFEYMNTQSNIPGHCLICGRKGPGPSFLNLHHQGACRACADRGYDSSKPGAFYRFEFAHQGETFLCYGISNVVNRRRKEYERKLEIKNFHYFHFDKGSIPQELEKQFHELRKESSVPASTCGVNGTVTESFSLSPENWELLTVFEAHWQAAAEKQAA